MNTSTGIGHAPASVAIVALGPSKREYFEECASVCSRRSVAEQTWGINCAVDVIRCDLGFLMDSPLYFKEASKSTPPLAGYGDWLWRKDNPAIFTTEESEDYPCLKRFPYEEVVRSLGHSYFNSTPAYALGYAIHLGVKLVKLYGLDYLYDNGHDGSKGRACIEYWCGLAIAKGMEIQIAKSSTLCDQNTGRVPYGFRVNPNNR